MGAILNRKRSMLIQAEWLKAYYSDLIGKKVVGCGIDFDLDFDYEVWPYLNFEDPETGEVFKVTISRDEEGNGPGFLFGLAEFGLNEKVREAYYTMDEQEVDRLLEQNGVKVNGW